MSFSFAAGQTYITDINQYMNSAYLNSTFASCAQVSVPSTGQLAFDLVCGDWGASRCSPTRWFEFMGDGENPYVPFQITYVQSAGSQPINGYVPHNPETVPCYMALDVS